GEVEEAFRDADVVVELELANGRACTASLEGRAVLADYEPGLGDLTVWLSSQAPHVARSGLAELLGLPEHSIRVIAPDVGGGFGAKSSLYPEEVAVPAIARKLG